MQKDSLEGMGVTQLSERSGDPGPAPQRPFTRSGPRSSHLQNDKNANDRDTESDGVHVSKCPSVSEIYTSAVGGWGGGRHPGHRMFSETRRLALSRQARLPTRTGGAETTASSLAQGSLLSLAAVHVKKKGESPFQEAHRNTTKAAASHTSLERRAPTGTRCPLAQGWRRSRSVGFQG